MSAIRITAILLGALLVAGLPLTGNQVPALAHEASAGVKERVEAMKGLGAAMRQIKRFVDGRGSQEAAMNAASTMSMTASGLLSLFPEGTGMDKLSGTGAKPVIWQNWDDFVAANDRFSDRIDAFSAALSGGDQGAIGAAFADLGRIGCGGCHRVFREKLH